jgi:hypothetical protein
MKHQDYEAEIASIFPVFIQARSGLISGLFWF